MTSSQPKGPALSVIIPVHNSAAHLERSLSNLVQSDFSDYECIVVDDGSTDGSAEVAERHGYRVVRTPKKSGPAAARNRGMQEAAGEIVYFFDSDVCIKPDTLRRIVERFAAEPEIDALIGSYDDEPGEPDFLSQYRNLFHHWIHQGASEDATTFWSGCGAIRKKALLEFGGFDENYRRPSIEDIELGYRMKADGRTIRLDKQLRVKHLKRWTFWQILRTDVLDRGIPWTELLLRYPHVPAALNTTLDQRLNVVLAHLLAISLAVAAFIEGAAFLGPVLLTAYLVGANYWLFSWRTANLKTRRTVETVGGLATAWLIAYALGITELMPVVLVGTMATFVQHQFLRHRRRSRPIWWISNVVAVSVLAMMAYLLSHVPLHLATVAPAVLLFVLLAANARLYAFLARRHNVFFAFTAIPFHFLYYYYCGLSFTAGVALFWSRKFAPKRRGVREPAATID